MKNRLRNFWFVLVDAFQWVVVLVLLITVAVIFASLFVLEVAP